MTVGDKVTFVSFVVGEKVELIEGAYVTFKVGDLVIFIGLSYSYSVGEYVTFMVGVNVAFEVGGKVKLEVGE